MVSTEFIVDNHEEMKRLDAREGDIAKMIGYPVVMYYRLTIDDPEFLAHWSHFVPENSGLCLVDHRIVKQGLDDLKYQLNDGDLCVIINYTLNCAKVYSLKDLPTMGIKWWTCITKRLTENDQTKKDYKSPVQYYHNRQFLNDLSHPQPSMIAAFHGPVEYQTEAGDIKSYMETQLSISDCSKTVRIHKTHPEDLTSYIKKIRLIAKVCAEFADILEENNNEN